MRRQLTKIALAATAILFIIGANTAFAQCDATLFAEGTGTEADPYQISTAEQLQNLNKCLGKDYESNYYVLNKNIDLTEYLSGVGNNSGAGWQPIGMGDAINCTNCFRGKLNGNGYKVSGLWINRQISKQSTGSDIGLFGSAYKAEIRNIGVEIDNTKGGVKGGSSVGGLVGTNLGGGNGIIIDCYVTGDVTGQSTYVGGLVGTNGGGVIRNSYATGNVTGSGNVGGLTGSNSGTISNSYATGSVSGVASSGGLTGYNSGTISNSYATGSVTGSNSIGGLVGDNNDGAISNSYATGNVTGSGQFIGGLIGNNSDKGTTSNSHAIGNVTGFKSVGGLIGNNNSNLISNNSYSTGGVSSDDCNVSLFAGGNGSKATPYQISTAKQLQNLNQCLGEGYQYNHYVLTNDIDLTLYLSGEGYDGGKGWQPIGEDVNTRFFGKLDGQGYKISGFWINRPDEQHIGLFGYALRAEIRNIGVELDNAKGGIKGEIYVGGLVGKNIDGIISNSYVAGNVTGTELVGGLVGTMDERGYDECYPQTIIANSYSTGSVSGKENVGGLVGLSKFEITNSYSTSDVFGTGVNVGGLVGISKSGGTISNSYSISDVTGSEKVGGLVGVNEGTISNSYSIGDVLGTTDQTLTTGISNDGTGGLVGLNEGIINNTYSVGNVSGGFDEICGS